MTFPDQFALFQNPDRDGDQIGSELDGKLVVRLFEIFNEAYPDTASVKKCLNRRPLRGGVPRLHQKFDRFGQRLPLAIFRVGDTILHDFGVGKLVHSCILYLPPPLIIRGS